MYALKDILPSVLGVGGHVPKLLAIVTHALRHRLDDAPDAARRSVRAKQGDILVHRTGEGGHPKQKESRSRVRMSPHTSTQSLSVQRMRTSKLEHISAIEYNVIVKYSSVRILYVRI